MSLKNELSKLDDDLMSRAHDGFFAKQLSGNDVGKEARDRLNGMYEIINNAIGRLVEHVESESGYDERVVKGIGLGACFFAGVLTEAAGLQEMPKL